MLNSRKGEVCIPFAERRGMTLVGYDQDSSWGPVQQARPSTFQEVVELALMVEKENNRQLEKGGDNKRKRENRDDDMKKIKISGEKTENASEYKPCTICKKTHKGKCWHEDCRNCGKPGHATKDCKADWFVLDVRNLDIRLLTVLKGTPMILNHRRPWEEFFN
ncbi:zinc finger, CCHC-type, retrotransposon gag domain protein [Tanacetum coccineum]